MARRSFSVGVVFMMWRLPFDRFSSSWPPIDPRAKTRFPALEDRFARADSEILPTFTKHDQAALATQASHRRYQLAVIVGALLTTVLGAAQAAWSDLRWPGVALALVGAATGLVANNQRRARPMVRYLTERAKAEELRSLYYRYLSGVDDQLDGRGLEQAVARIEYSDKNGSAS
jgi:hypothetical protein